MLRCTNLRKADVGARARADRVGLRRSARVPNYRTVALLARLDDAVAADRGGTAIRGADGARSTGERSKWHRTAGLVRARRRTEVRAVTLLGVVDDAVA